MGRLRIVWAIFRLALERAPVWIDARSGRTLPIIAGAAGEGDGGEGDGGKGGEGDAAGGSSGDGDGDGDAGDGEAKWKSLSRKNEREARKAQKERDELAAKLKEREDADKSEQEKAIETAREEARREAMKEADAQRRDDRLEVAVTRLASRGVKVEGDGKQETVRFADADDALLRIQAQIRRGDLDADEIFDEGGRVKNDALSTALAEIAGANPHLVGKSGVTPAPTGDADGRRGEPAENDLEGMTPEDHAKRKYGAKA